MSNILILGHKGFIGRHLISHISSNSDYKVFKTDLRLAQTNELKSFVLNNKIDTIIHLISNLIPSSDKFDFAISLDNVINPTYRLIDLAAEYNVKFIFISSGGAVYGNHPMVLIDENSDRNPINYYGYSKVMIEDYILFKNRINNLQYLILRPSNVYGEGQDFTKNQGFIAVAVQKILNKDKVVVWGDGENIKNYIYITDFVKIVERILDEKINNNIFNVSSNTNISLNSILEVIFKITGQKKDIEYIKSKKFDVHNFNMSNAHLQRYLNFNFTDFTSGVSNQISETEKIVR